MTDMASASYVSISQGDSCCICFLICDPVNPVLNESCISHSFHLYKFVLFILPSSFEEHTMHYNDASHIDYAILSTHLTSESASGMCPQY
jgi:hypothetical protein